MTPNLNILAIIPSRKGSTRAPGKNMKIIGGKPLICYTIEEALKSNLISNIVLINDILETEELAKKFNIERIEEPERLAKNGIPALDVVRYVLDYLTKTEREKPDFIIYLQPTSPLRTHTQIDEALNLLIDSNSDSIVSVGEIKERPEWMFKFKEKNKLEKYSEKFSTGHYENEKLFLLNGAIFAFKTECVEKFKKVLYEMNPIGYPMDKISSLDIDTNLDMAMVENILDKKNKIFKIGDRKIGENFPPFIIAEIGINHEGNLEKAKRMVLDACNAGAECVKFQSHIVNDEMSPHAKEVIPSHTNESIYNIIEKCSLSEKEEIKLKNYVEELGMIYLCTPFSRESANRLERMNVLAYKIGSGECNNYPLIKHIASFGKPIILSTGMNNLDSISKSVKILEENNVPYAILQCTSIYPTPYEKIRLTAINELKEKFPNAIVGLSDHSVSIYPCFGAIPLGARILEKHFTSDKSWTGPDIPLSITPNKLKQLIIGSNAIYKSLQGKKEIFEEEKSTIKFAHSSVVTIKDIQKGDKFNKENIWVKRPGTGEIKSEEFEKILGKSASKTIKKDTQLRYEDVVSYE